MKQFTQQLQKKADSIKLTASERKELRERVLSYMEYHPLPTQLRDVAMNKQTKAGAGAALQSEPYRAMPIAWKEFLQLGAIAAVVLLVVVPVIAERTVPGDTLYAVKVQFNEELRSSLTWDSYEKVEWETARLNRRLAEARLLADEGRLTADVDAEVAKAVRAHTQNAKNEIAALGERDSEAAAIASIELDSALSVQANALAAGSATGTEAIAAAIADAERSVEFSTTSLPAYDKLMARVELNTTRIYELLEQLSAESVSSDDVVLTAITRRFEDIERSVGEAVALREEDESAARAMLVSVLQRTQKLTVFITEVAVRDSVSVEDLVPMVLTSEEKNVMIKSLSNDLEAALAEIEVGSDEIDERAVAEKLTAAQRGISKALEEARDVEFTVAMGWLTTASDIAADARMILAQAALQSPKNESATSTPSASSTATSSVPVSARTPAVNPTTDATSSNAVGVAVSTTTDEAIR